ncbi:hypothetical protein CC80DRAFT_588164 [Byssothecium circinans]|uniref:Uncharacterized protein n=1 Tax=Byssothecium circinans TaxID=147558 RepID=A0A6A5UFZ7_9PLEO|nr:hypothetical protein CC80DRAFT_588164 [Byssothecium circinans]
MGASTGARLLWFTFDMLERGGWMLPIVTPCVIAYHIISTIAPPHNTSVNNHSAMDGTTAAECTALCVRVPRGTYKMEDVLKPHGLSWKKPLSSTACREASGWNYRQGSTTKQGQRSGGSEGISSALARLQGGTGLQQGGQGEQDEQDERPAADTGGPFPSMFFCRLQTAPGK